jgi:molecular chaperone GrpE
MFEEDPEKAEVELDKETVAEPAAAPSPGAPAQLPAGPSAEELAEQVVRLKAELEDLKNTMIRRQADFENFRKRLERERAEDGRRAVALVAGALLPVLDAFERALAVHGDPAYEDYRKGFELIERQLRDALGRFGVEPIEAEGKAFDPHDHEAVERLEMSDVAEGTVVGVLQRGYRLRERVLRPAQVRVAVKPAKFGIESE